MISDLMLLTRNYFEKFYINGTIEIVDGKVALPNKFIKGQYIRIINSLLNDGVYKITEKSGDNIATLSSILQDETFNGFIVGLAVPKGFELLSEKIDTWNAKNDSRRGIASESVAGYYSWTSNAKNVEEAFSSDIAQYKKPYMPDTWFITHTEDVSI